MDESKDVIVELYNKYDPKRKLDRFQQEPFFFGAVQGYYGDLDRSCPITCEDGFKKAYKYTKSEENKKLFYDGFELGKRERLKTASMDGGDLRREIK